VEPANPEGRIERVFFFSMTMRESIWIDINKEKLACQAEI
jgi:hypothetical protein